MLHELWAPVAQLDSASVFGTEGCRFESYRVCYFVLKRKVIATPSFQLVTPTSDVFLVDSYGPDRTSPRHVVGPAKYLHSHDAILG